MDCQLPHGCGISYVNGMPTSGGNVNEREMKSQIAVVLVQTQQVQEQAQQESSRWIEDEVEELERWDGLE